jgi:uncharacterized membrane protein
MLIRQASFAIVVASFALAMPAYAQPAQQALVAPLQADPPAAAQKSTASLSHSALKATTFKAGSTAVNLAVLSYATGTVVGGVALSAFILGASWVIYTANDYVWDSYSPPPVKQAANESFDATADVWRNTGKFLTYKPIIASIKLASIYVYTGSAAIAGVFGLATVVTNTGVFYANNMAWDFYDWYAGAPANIVVAKQP